MGKTYRILSLDGGGTWALIQVMALQQLYSEHARGHYVLRDFDLVAANSGGSITAAGLIGNLPLSDILDYFCDPKKAAQIFKPLTYRLVPGPTPFRYIFHKVVRRIAPIGAKYETHQKLRSLQALVTDSPRVFQTSDGKPITGPELKLWQVPGEIARSAESGGHHVDFLICAFNYNRQRAKFFRTNARSKSSSSPALEDATLCEAIHASTNAPVNFFVSPARVQKTLYWDGAISGLNNPTLAAITEALANGIDAGDIRILSLGTGTVSLPPAETNQSDIPELLQKSRHSTLFGDVGELAASILDDPPDMATYVSHVILSPGGLDRHDYGNASVVRMTPLVRPKRQPCDRWTLPTGFTREEFSRLMNLELDATTDGDIALLRKLATAWIAGDIANQPIRENSYMEPNIGDKTFASAVDHWQRVKDRHATAAGAHPERASV